VYKLACFVATVRVGACGIRSDHAMVGEGYRPARPASRFPTRQHIVRAKTFARFRLSTFSKSHSWLGSLELSLAIAIGTPSSARYRLTGCILRRNKAAVKSQPVHASHPIPSVRSNSNVGLK